VSLGEKNPVFEEALRKACEAQYQHFKGPKTGLTNFTSDLQHLSRKIENIKALKREQNAKNSAIPAKPDMGNVDEIKAKVAKKNKEMMESPKDFDAKMEYYKRRAEVAKKQAQVKLKEFNEQMFGMNVDYRVKGEIRDYIQRIDDNMDGKITSKSNLQCPVCGADDKGSNNNVPGKRGNVPWCWKCQAPLLDKSKFKNYTHIKHGESVASKLRKIMTGEGDEE